MFGNLLGFVAYFQHVNKRRDKAEKLYGKALRLGMTNARYLSAYGTMFLTRGDFEQAIKIYNIALKNKLSPDRNIFIRMNKAVAQYKLGMHDQAIATLEELHKKHPCTFIYQTLGYLYLLNHDIEKAIGYNAQALEYEDKDVVILDNNAQMHLMLEEYDKARDFLEKAYDMRSNQVDVLYHYAMVEEHDGNISKAIDYLKQARECRINAINDVTLAQVDQKIMELEKATMLESDSE